MSDPYLSQAGQAATPRVDGVGSISLKEKIRSRIDELTEGVQGPDDVAAEEKEQDLYEWGIIDGLEEALIIIEDHER